MVVFEIDLKADPPDAFISEFATHPPQNVPTDAAALPAGVHGEPIDAAGVIVARHSDRANEQAIEVHYHGARRILRQAVGQINWGFAKRDSEQSRELGGICQPRRSQREPRVSRALSRGAKENQSMFGVLEHGATALGELSPSDRPAGSHEQRPLIPALATDR